MSRDGVRPAGGHRRLRHAGRLAILLALSILTATATTTTSGGKPAGSSGVTAIVVTAANQAGHVEAGSSAGDVRRDGQDTTVRVVRKVRAVFLPDGVTAPTLALARPIAQQPVLTADAPALRTPGLAYTHPRRGPPAIATHPFS